MAVEKAAIPRGGARARAKRPEVFAAVLLTELGEIA